MMAGTKKTAQVASCAEPVGTKRWRSSVGTQPSGPSGAATFVMSTMAWPQSKAKYTPNEMSVPKIAPKIPRSRT